MSRRSEATSAVGTWLTVVGVPLLQIVGGCKDEGTSSSSSPASSFPPATLDPSDFAEIEAVTGASAPQVFYLGYVGVFLAAFENGEVCSTVDGVQMCMPIGNGCPSMTETADGFVVEGGGCTTDDGSVWTGRIVGTGVTLSGDGQVSPPGDSATIAYEALTIESDSECPDASARSTITLDGQLELTSDGDAAFDFDLTLEVTASGTADDCSDLDDASGGYEYSGHRRETGSQQIWNGSGVIGSSARGRYDAETVDEVLDTGMCANEALSGTTTITAGEDVVVVTYDGATDCDDTSTVSWSFNGTDQGELEGVRCRAGTTGRPGLAWSALGGMLLLGLRRRRG